MIPQELSQIDKDLHILQNLSLYILIQWKVK
jgi:hypothetical protein